MTCTSIHEGCPFFFWMHVENCPVLAQSSNKLMIGRNVALPTPHLRGPFLKCCSEWMGVLITFAIPMPEHVIVDDPVCIVIPEHLCKLLHDRVEHGIHLQDLHSKSIICKLSNGPVHASL